MGTRTTQAVKLCPTRGITIESTCAQFTVHTGGVVHTIGAYARRFVAFGRMAVALTRHACAQSAAAGRRHTIVAVGA